jgi:HYR domain
MATSDAPGNHPFAADVQANDDNHGGPGCRLGGACRVRTVHVGGQCIAARRAHIQGPRCCLPLGLPSTAECHSRPASPVAVPGLGFVSQSYVAAVDLAPAGCPAGTQKILSYPARLIVKDRGQIFIAVAASSSCADAGVPLLSVAQSFTITGGTGAFAGASGSGIVSRTHVGCCPGFGTDNWNGTITAPGFVADLTPPTIKGVHDRVVHAPAAAEHIRVSYNVTALDAVDGALRPTCRPRSGSRFRVGRRTTVRCSVSDRSANLRRARFRINVRRG